MAQTKKPVTKTKENRSRQTLRLYLKDISKIPLLTPEEERELGYRIRQGDEIAVEKLVEANLRFVVKVAKRYRGFGVSFLDLINEGNLGLIEAARRFDPDRKVRFISYAVWWIRQSIMTALSSLGRPFKLPIKINAALCKVGVSMANRFSRMNQKPTLEELAGDVGMTTKELSAILEIGGEGVSLNQPFTKEREAALEDFLAQRTIPSAEYQVIKTSVHASLRQVLDELGPREKEILKLRYGLDTDTSLTLQGIADRIGLSRERVRQIEEKALQKLRQNRKTLALMNVYDGVLAHAY